VGFRFAQKLMTLNDSEYSQNAYAVNGPKGNLVRVQRSAGVSSTGLLVTYMRPRTGIWMPSTHTDVYTVGYILYIVHITWMQ